MQKHYDKLQRAKEEAALAAIRRLQPEVSPAIWALALDECNWDADRASSMIAAFKVARVKEVHAIQQVSTFMRFLEYGLELTSKDMETCYFKHLLTKHSMINPVCDPREFYFLHQTFGQSSSHPGSPLSLFLRASCVCPRMSNVCCAASINTSRCVRVSLSDCSWKF